MVHGSYEQELKADASASAHKAKTLLERMLDQAEQANLEALSLVNRPCVDNLLLLRKRVALEPFLRSVNLARGGVIGGRSSAAMMRGKRRSWLSPIPCPK